MKNKKPKVCLFVCLWIEVLCYVVPLQLIVLREFQSCFDKVGKHIPSLFYYSLWFNISTVGLSTRACSFISQ
jgi:hypothetical protein